MDIIYKLLSLKEILWLNLYQLLDVSPPQNRGVLFVCFPPYQLKNYGFVG